MLVMAAAAARWSIFESQRRYLVTEARHEIIVQVSPRLARAICEEVDRLVDAVIFPVRVEVWVIKAAIFCDARLLEARKRVS